MSSSNLPTPPRWEEGLSHFFFGGGKPLLRIEKPSRRDKSETSISTLQLLFVTSGLTGSRCYPLRFERSQAYCCSHLLGVIELLQLTLGCGPGR
ncbi:hypothetical protein BDW69DRAFT_95063 [Aspergillus filifer]